MKVIQPLTISDLSRIVDAGIGTRWGQTGYPGVFNADTFKRSWENLLNSGMGTILANVDDSGNLLAVFGGMVAPQPLTGELCGHQVFVFSNPNFPRQGASLPLFREFERICRQRGVTAMSISAPTEGPGATLEKVATRGGYRLAERVFLKQLEDK